MTAAIEREEARAPSTWLSQRERGTVFAIRALSFWATLLGRWPSRILVRAIALYYALADRTARRASRRYLALVLDESPRFRHVYAHIRCFAQVTLDRLFLVRGLTRPFRFRRTGREHLQALTDSKRGAMLIGAHLGSFEAMRASGEEERFPIHIVGHFDNAAMINAVLEQLDPEAMARVLHVGRDPVGLALELKEKIDRGEMIAILADRVGLNDKWVSARFFGQEAAFPTGPFLLASALKCPIYLVFGLYYEPNRYELFCEPFVERVSLPRKGRQEALSELVQAYATRVEDYCRRAPYNWFNFYDFWETPRP